MAEETRAIAPSGLATTTRMVVDVAVAEETVEETVGAGME